MWGLGAASLVVLVAALPRSAASGSLSLAPHPMRPLAGAPGLYASYDWPTGGAASPDMEVDHTWTTIPDGSNGNGNGVFASSQYWYESYGQPCPNRSDHGMSCNSAGYMGSQVMKGDAENPERHVFIFSCWDADSAHKVGWTVDMVNGNGCSRFGGEGTGSHCMLAVPSKENVVYSFKVAYDSKNATGAFWTGTLTSTETISDGVTKRTSAQKVGTLYYPHLPNMVGFGHFKIQSDDFLEYFAGGDCDKAVNVAVGITGPYYHGRTLAATQAYPSYGASGGCNHSAVRKCIPGGDCGKPNVLLTGGKDVRRDVPDKTPLWE